MKALPADRRGELMTSLGFERGPKLTRVADSEQSSAARGWDRRDVVKTIFASGLGVSALANRSSEAKEPDSEMVKTNDGKLYTKDQYFDLVIEDAMSYKLLKQPVDFKSKDLGGREIEDTQGYKKYIDSIKDRAAQFKDPRDFSRFIETLHFLKDTPGSNQSVLTPRQVEFLVEYPSIQQASYVIKKLYGGMKNGGATVHQARVKADELIRNLEESRFQSTAVSSK